MLGKLLKHDFKQTSRAILLSYVVGAILMLLVFIAKIIDIDMFIATSTFTVIATIVAIPLFTLVMIFINYNSTMFKEQGYLTNTLPVSSNSLIFSKVIVAGVFIALSVIYSIFGAILLMTILTNGSSYIVTQILAQLQITSGAEWQFITLMGISSIIGGIFIIAIIFASVTLGNVSPFQRMGKASSFIILVVLYIIGNTLQSIVSLVLPMGLKLTKNGLVWTNQTMLQGLFYGTVIDNSSANSVSYGSVIGLGGILFQLLASVGLFFLISYLTKKKVNVR